MSHQPSTTESLKDTAKSAYETVANTITPESKKPGYDPDKDAANFKKDAHGNTVKKGDYKDKLNQAAVGKGDEETYVEKGVSTLQQTAFEQGPAEKTKGGPPNRPDHDVQVEQFLRKQYHSRSGDGMPEVGEREK